MDWLHSTGAQPELAVPRKRENGAQAEAYATKPSAPKGGIEFARLTARLKPCPDTKPTTNSVLDESITDLVR